MKDFLFGWISKPAYLRTLLDELIGSIEILLIAFLIVFIYAIIRCTIDDIKERKRKDG